MAFLFPYLIVLTSCVVVVSEVRSSVLTQADLYDSLKILYFMEGLFYEARVKEIQAPDVYGVVVKGERGNRPHILSREELLNDAVSIGGGK